MQVLPRAHRRFRLAGTDALTIGLAGGAVSGLPAAQARASSPVITGHEAVSWGSNVDGEPGNGATTNGAKFGPVTWLGTSVVQVAAGSGAQSLAVLSDGTVWAWGDNTTGELGNGTLTTSAVPVRVAGLSQVTGIAAGTDASYAISTRSITALTTLRAWGGNGRGQLGDGTMSARTTPEQVAGISAPGIAGITAGKESAVALGTDGSVWGWGDNTGGQPGSGITQLSANSFSLSDLVYSDVLALKSDGTVLAWGDNSRGQLGDGTTASRIGPGQIRDLTGATQVSAGASFGLVVTALATVPNVRGLTITTAGSALQAAGFVLGQVSTAPDYTCNHIGVIAGQSPAAGTSAMLGSPVRVTVGARPPTPCP